MNSKRWDSNPRFAKQNTVGLLPKAPWSAATRNPPQTKNHRALKTLTPNNSKQHSNPRFASAKPRGFVAEGTVEQRDTQFKALPK